MLVWQGRAAFGADPCIQNAKGVPLTVFCIKCSLALYFIAVNIIHGAKPPATTRERTHR
jgi:hypothetical protein